MGRWLSALEAPIPVVDLEAELRTNALLSFGFLFMIAISASLAALGLIANSAAVIIGAMIIAPLMNPITAAAFSIVRGDGRLLARSSLTIVIGVAVVIAISFLTAKVVGTRVAGSEILSRSMPNLIDLGVAICAGSAGAFAVTRKRIGNALPGVAIAVALVPPLCVTGIGLAVGSSGSIVELALEQPEGVARVETGSLILFLTNLSGIILFSAIVFLVQGYGEWKRASRGLAVTVLLLGLITLPLISSMQRVLFRSRVLHGIQMLSSSNPQWEGAHLVGVTIQHKATPPLILLEVYARAGVLGAGDARLLEEGIESVVGIDVDLEIQVAEYTTIKANEP